MLPGPCRADGPQTGCDSVSPVPRSWSAHGHAVVLVTGGAGLAVPTQEPAKKPEARATSRVPRGPRSPRRTAPRAAARGGVSPEVTLWVRIPPVTLWAQIPLDPDLAPARSSLGVGRAECGLHWSARRRELVGEGERAGRSTGWRLEGGRAGPCVPRVCPVCVRGCPCVSRDHGSLLSLTLKGCIFSVHFLNVLLLLILYSDNTKIQS